MLTEGSLFAQGGGTEASVDRFIWGGNFDEARERIDDTEPEERQKQHHLLLKRAALPFYDLALNGTSSERIERAMDVYGEAAALLEDEMAHFLQQSDGTKEYKSSFGRLTELSVFCLQARDLQWQEPTLVLLPATQEDDRNYRRGIDFHLVGMREEQLHTYPIQLKTRVKEEDMEYYDPSINLLGLDQIDSEYGRPQHYNSLATTLLRDAAGKSTPRDLRKLNNAMIAFYELITSEGAADLIQRPSETDWQPLAS